MWPYALIHRGRGGGGLFFFCRWVPSLGVFTISTNAPPKLENDNPENEYFLRFIFIVFITRGSRSNITRHAWVVCYFMWWIKRIVQKPSWKNRFYTHGWVKARSKYTPAVKTKMEQQCPKNDVLLSTDGKYKIFDDTRNVMKRVFYYSPSFL